MSSNDTNHDAETLRVFPKIEETPPPFMPDANYPQREITKAIYKQNIKTESEADSLKRQEAYVPITSIPIEKPKRKDTRQRKFMELSVYNRLIDQFNELQSENKRLTLKSSKAERQAESLTERYCFEQNAKLVIGVERDKFKAELAKQKACKELYRAATIFLAACLVTVSIYVIW